MRTIALLHSKMPNALTTGDNKKVNDFLRRAMLRTLNENVERVFDTPRKDAHDAH
jgi:hypothetical protein